MDAKMMEEKKQDIVVLEPGTPEVTVNAACCTGARNSL